MPLSKQKSEEQAEIIKMLAMPVSMLDIEYLKELAETMRSTASWQESAAVINPTYNQKRNDLLRRQADALEALVKYSDALARCRDLLKGIQEDSYLKMKLELMFV